MEDPIPDTIGVGVVFGTAGAGGVVMLVLGSILGRGEDELDAWARRGVSAGFAVGALFYGVALAWQVL
ncbi:MAG: hypothetical protein ACLGG5_03425 [Thermoleophilia bacterium]